MTVKTYELLPPKALAYLGEPFETLDLTAYADWQAPQDRPRGVCLPIPAGLDPSAGLFVTLRSEGLADENFMLAPDAASITLRSLSPGRVYRCTFTSSADGESRETAFATSPTLPRMLDIEGIRNVRDAGGWPTEDGRMRMGLLYRGSELNECADHGLALTEAGRETLLRTARIRTDIDLRSAAEGGNLTESPLGGTVQYVRCPVLGYMDAFREEFIPSLRRIFKLLAAPASYPVYLHCWAGADRTGTVVAILKAALGVSYEAITRDYELSTLSIFGVRGRCNRDFKYDEVFAHLAEHYPGHTLREHALAYLRTLGLTEAELEGLARIWIEETAEGRPLPTVPPVTEVARRGTLHRRCVMICAPEARKYTTDALAAFRALAERVMPTEVRSPDDPPEDPPAGSPDGTLTVYIGERPPLASTPIRLGTEGYLIHYASHRLTLLGDTAEHTYTAVSRLIHEILEGDASALTGLFLPEGFCLCSPAARREAYIADITRFEPVWRYEWRPAAWWHDFAEKRAAMTDPAARPLTEAHRGDLESYPENSIEAIISATLRGADLIEVDVVETADGVLVLNHGYDLAVTTDAHSRRGTVVDGLRLPDSTDLRDWTYAQLSHLHLATGNGQYTAEGDELTPFRIATLEEAFTVCRGRCFLILDRTTSAQWEKIHPLIRATGACECDIMATWPDSNAYFARIRTEFGTCAPSAAARRYAWTGMRNGRFWDELSMHTKEEFDAHYAEELRHGCFVLTNRLHRLIDYLTEHYGPADGGRPM